MRRYYLWTSIILIVVGLYGLTLVGCMTGNQLKAEQSYYDSMVAMQRQQAAQPLVQIIPQDKDKPIIMQNVASFTVFAPPQGGDGPRLTQYIQKDYVQPWLNLMGMAVPWFGAWGIVKASSDAIASIPHTNNNTVTATGASNAMSGGTMRNTTTTNTVSGTGNVAAIGSGPITNATAPPTVVFQPPPVIVSPSYPPK